MCAAPDLPTTDPWSDRLVRVVPGIRMAGGATHDQARVATPREALAAGADLLVVGRAVTAADDPVQAATDLAAHLAGGTTRGWPIPGRPHQSAAPTRVLAMAGLPQLTDEQRRAALAKAAEARRVRAEIKELLKMGTLSLSELLDRSDNDRILAKMKVLSVLEALPKLGKVKARRTMDEVGISDSRRLRGLGSQQRAELVARFG